MGCPSLAIRALHQFGIAVISGDQHGAALTSHRIQQPADASIHRLNGFLGGIHDPGVPHHVWVGVVDHNQRVVRLLDGCDTAVGELFGRHGR